MKEHYRNVTYKQPQTQLPKKGGTSKTHKNIKTESKENVSIFYMKKLRALKTK